MEVRITAEMYYGVEHVLAMKPFEYVQKDKGDEENVLGRDYFRYDKHIDVDLRKYRSKDLRKLVEACQKVEHIRGIKTLIRDIENWIIARKSTEGAAKVKARSVRQARSLVIEYLRRFPRHHLYAREQEGIEGANLVYYISEINYYPRREREGYPEHFTVSAIYEEFGVRKSTSIMNIAPRDCIGKAPAEIIVDAGYMVETDELREDYETSLKKFNKVKDKIGEQYLAVGIADDENIDGNDDKESRWHSSRYTKLMLDKDGEPSKVVIDIFHETEREKKSRRDDDAYVSGYWWKNISKEDPEDDIEVEIFDEDPIPVPEIPVHPYVAVFDLKRHKRLKMHSMNLTRYKYDTEIRKKLILPERNAKLIDTLLNEQETGFKDVIKGKAGGIIVLCQGKPGTGKTLTAEVYAESMERALYTVQCSQLGTDPKELEEALLKVLARGRRWKAVMLLDEADVYVHERGSDLQQNAIVGVFLRVLEYHAGTLFLTTNRGDLVDDAILSRCTARIPYEVPDEEHQKLIWDTLVDVNQADLSLPEIKKIVKQHPKLSGRDVKNLLKLGMMVARDRKCILTADLITEVKAFKPTCDEEDTKENFTCKLCGAIQ